MSAGRLAVPLTVALGHPLVTLTLPWVPALNHYYRHVGSRVLISQGGRAYRHAVAEACLVQLVGVARPFTGRLGLMVEAFPPDRRVRDLDGLFKALLNALEHAHVFENDSQIVLLAAQKPAPSPAGRSR